MGVLIVVEVEIFIEVSLHLIDGFIALLSAHNSEVLLKKRSMNPLYKAITLKSLHFGFSMSNAS